MTQSMAIGKRMRLARIERDMRQADVAAAIGCSQISVSDWERGRCAPLPHRAMQIEALLGVPMRAWYESAESGA